MTFRIAFEKTHCGVWIGLIPAQVCLAVLLFAFAEAPAQTPPEPPTLSRESAGRLPTLARQAMLRYLRDRIDAKDMPIPQELLDAHTTVDGKDVPFAEADYPVILTLRHEGAVAARQVYRGSGLAGNVIAAALRAMRSRSLPDRVSRAYLESLTIELEIMGPPAAIEPEQIKEELRPGLDGLSLAVGVNDPRLRGGYFTGVYQQTVVSPATAYVLGWDGRRMKKQCLSDIRWRAENQSLPRRWSRFATLHYVSYPDPPAEGAARGTWFLYRGKLLSPPPPADDGLAWQQIARRVGDFLLRHQEASGLYAPPGARSSTAQQLHAAWAMLKLSKAVKEGQAYANSAKAVLGHVAKQYIKINPAGKYASVFTVDPRQEVLATAMFALAAAEDSRDEAGRAVETKMLAFLRSRMDTKGRFTDAKNKPLDDVSSAVALLAMQMLEPNPADEQWRDGVEALLYEAGEMDSDTSAGRHPLSAAGEAWLTWAILAGKCGRDKQYRTFASRFIHRLLQRQQGPGAPLDEIGAFVTPAGQVETLPSALATVLLHQARESKSLGPSPEESRRFRDAVVAGKSFCRQMLYQTEEAYFAINPSAWRGGARREAESEEISLEACAATIEAMLLK
ncbi:MAG: hypothetical protein JW849_11130 [Phycisphaerae bacterium]|nr:hypothetical protein [Phycisphaerae bacterium]